MKSASTHTPRPTTYPAYLFATLILAAVLLSCIERKPERLSKRESPVTGELNSMLREHDALLGNTPKENDLRGRVHKRHREMILLFLSQALIVEPSDMHHAAQLLVSSNDAKTPDFYLLAFNMATEAARKGNEESRYLAAACMDQYLLAQDLPQKYGTQQYKDRFGRVCLSYYDTLTSDSERAIWNVPPLDSIKKLISAQNR